MAIAEQLSWVRQEDLERIKRFRLMDDVFLTKCFEDDTESTQLVLRIILNKPDLVVLDVHTQVFVANLLTRSVKLDVVATDSEGRKINVEVQREDKGAGKRRASLLRRMGERSQELSRKKPAFWWQGKTQAVSRKRPTSWRFLCSPGRRFWSA